jgi:hypothetical protein
MQRNARARARERRPTRARRLQRVLMAHSHWSVRSQMHPSSLLSGLCSYSSLSLSLIQTRIIIIIMHTHIRCARASRTLRERVAHMRSRRGGMIYRGNPTCIFRKNANTSFMENTFVSHDIRRWHANATRDPLAPEHWSTSPLAKALTNLRHTFGAFFVRRWHFVWSFSDPTQWRLVRANPEGLSGKSVGRGKTKRLELVNLFDVPGQVIPATWDSWLGLPNRLDPGLQEPARPATIAPSNDAGAGPPPSGSILGHPGAFAYPQGSALRDAILLRYFELAGCPHPTQWQKVLPPVTPESEFFTVYNWQKIAKWVESPW